ncbi:ferric reductase-like transmembrane domain-containing protein [Specibacter cremeus]|uniref:ferric reductase-like transmembrane domain-containing protein n=1 Tax=Specibacter cremeus TaxID=1629051 RepID=UPI000F78EB9F|nr:ferric reductase-like transmembrane domain-containing protein [Specibacter cremeus]
MDEVLWAAGRAGGFVALALFTCTVLLGILNRSGRPVAGVPRFSLTLIHRNVSLLALVFLALHVGTLLLDPFAKLTLTDVVVPFLGHYRPFWQGLGTVALDLAIAVVLTSLLRHRLGYRAFRLVHWLSYALWPVAVAHGIGNGTDGFNGWFLGATVVAVVLVLAAVAWRLSAGFVESARLRQGSAS